MQLENPPIKSATASRTAYSISLQAAIDAHPLTVDPSTTVLEAIALMAKSSSSCILPHLVNPGLHEPRPSCVLVLSGTALLGLLTERDIVRFAASGINLQGIPVADVMTPNLITLRESDFTDIFTVLNLFRQHRIRHLPILDDRSRVLGIVTPDRIRQLLQPVYLLEWRRVEEVMTIDVIRATRTASLQKLAKLMDKYRVSCVVIVEENTDKNIIPVGIVTERDIVQFQALELDFLKVRALEVMSSPLFSLNPADSLWTAHQQMLRRRVRRLVVSAEATGALVGILTQTNLLRALDPTQMYSTIEVLQQEVRQLQVEKVELKGNRNLELEKQLRQRIEESLQRERDFAAAVLDTVGSLVMVLDRQGRIVRFNKTCQEITDYEFDEVKDRYFWDLFLIPEEVEPVKAVFQQLLAGQFPNQYENYWLTKAGDRRLIAWSNTALVDRAGAVEYVIATGTDITDRFQASEALLRLNQELETRVQQRTTDLMNLNQELLQEIAIRQQAEAALRASEERFRAIFEQAAVGMVQAALDGRFGRVNQKFCDIVGYSPAELLTKTFLEITHPLDIGPDKQYVEQLLAGKIKTFSMEKRYLRSDGSIVWVNLTGSLVRKPSGEPDYFIAVVEDIKYRKDAESELLHKSQALANFSANLKKLHRLNTTTYKDLADLFDDYLKTGCEIFGLPAGMITEIDGRSYLLRHVESDWQFIETECNGMLTDRDFCRSVRSKENQFSFYMSTPIFVNDNKYGKLIFYSMEVTSREVVSYEREILELMAQSIGRFIAARQMEIEREQATAALRDSQRLIKRIAESTPNILYLYDLIEQANVYVNSGITEILGYTPEEVQKMAGHVLQNLMHPDDLAKLPEHMQRFATVGDDEILEIEYRMRDASGEWRWLHSRETLFSKTSDNQPQEILGTATDITDRKLASEQLQQANEQLTSKVRELEQHNEEMALLRDLNEFMQACMTVEEAYEAIATLIGPLFPGCAGGLFMTNSSNNLVETVAEWGTRRGSSTLFMPNECWGLRRGRVHFVEQQRPGLFCKHVRGAGKGHTDAMSTNQLPTESLCVPMMAQGETLGLFYLSAQDPGVLTAAKQQLAQTVSEHIGLALANLQLRETLQQQSIRDPLTGLFNRRYMEESLERELRRCDRNKQPLGIIMLDVDHFKRFNDTFGHEAGDAVLRELGMFLQRNIRDSDIACRYGGEELMLILPEASLHDTGQRAEQLREGIKQLRVQHRRQQLGAVTASLGVACFPEHGFTGSAVIRIADAALYQAKKAGRDRVVTASDTLTL